MEVSYKLQRMPFVLKWGRGGGDEGCKGGGEYYPIDHSQVGFFIFHNKMYNRENDLQQNF